MRDDVSRNVGFLGPLECFGVWVIDGYRLRLSVTEAPPVTIARMSGTEHAFSNTPGRCETHVSRHERGVTDCACV